MTFKVLKIFVFLIIVKKSSISLSRNFQWGKNIFNSDDCSKERQPIVEYYYKNGMEYLLFSQRVTWVEARILCRSYNSRLAILDTVKKALGVAQSIAESNIVMEDTWLGGRRIDSIWYWIDRENSKNKEISTETNVEDFPPWIRKPNRPTKECLAIDRRSHEHPNFIDIDCRLQRPFICEKNAGEIITSPIPSKWIRINKNTFTVYHGRVTWQEAAMYCRSQGTRLAILKTSTVIQILANSMTKTRPDIESVWIGGHFSYGHWVWMATGSTLNSLSDDNEFPPWRFGHPEKNDGCLLLDRHIEGNSSFIELSCDRKRDFVCEEYSDNEDDDWMNEPVKVSHENSTYIIYANHMSWMKSQIFCEERGSVLANVQHMNAINWIIEAMGDHPREISHVWLGGKFNVKNDQWRWIENDEIISKDKNQFGFPPWANIEGDMADHDSDNSHCLNLDRTDHVKSHFYGLDCNSKQSFVCKITCNVPPKINNGKWNCNNITDGRQCHLKCNKKYIIMGIENITCTFKNGWMSERNLNEFPLCLKSRDYTLRLIRSLNQSIQKSSGYFIILDNVLTIMQLSSIKFSEQLLTAFPPSNNLKVGLTSYISDPPIHLPFNQTDYCIVLSKIHHLERKVAYNYNFTVDINRIYNDISMYNGRRISIIAIIDSARVIQYFDTLLQLKIAGHHIIIIGMKYDWKVLLPLATIGYDRRINLFLFDESEFDLIIDELQHNRKKSKCIDRKNSTEFDDMTYRPSVYRVINHPNPNGVSIVSPPYIINHFNRFDNRENSSVNFNESVTTEEIVDENEVNLNGISIVSPPLMKNDDNSYDSNKNLSVTTEKIMDKNENLIALPTFVNVTKEPSFADQFYRDGFSKQTSSAQFDSSN